MVERSLQDGTLVVRPDSEVMKVEEGKESQGLVGGGEDVADSENVLRAQDILSFDDPHAEWHSSQRARFEAMMAAHARSALAAVPTTEDSTSSSTSDSISETSTLGSADDSLYMITDIDDRVPYRQGWPLLPVLPVVTSRDNIPKKLSSSEPESHIIHFHKILTDLGTPERFEVVHRANPGKQTGKSTLTLCVLSFEAENVHWPDAIRALRSYTQSQDLTLAVEVVDSRVFNGIHTLPILATETALMKTISKRRHSIVRILDQTGQPWTSLEFFWRGVGKTRKECRPTVLIGTPCPNKRVWWEEVMPAVEEKVGGEWISEICFREVVRY